MSSKRIQSNEQSEPRYLTRYRARIISEDNVPRNVQSTPSGNNGNPVNFPAPSVSPAHFPTHAPAPAATSSAPSSDSADSGSSAPSGSPAPTVSPAPPSSPAHFPTHFPTYVLAASASSAPSSASAPSGSSAPSVSPAHFPTHALASAAASSAPSSASAHSDSSAPSPSPTLSVVTTISSAPALSPAPSSPPNPSSDSAQVDRNLDRMTREMGNMILEDDTHHHHPSYHQEQDSRILIELDSAVIPIGRESLTDGLGNQTLIQISVFKKGRKFQSPSFEAEQLQLGEVLFLDYGISLNILSPCSRDEWKIAFYHGLFRFRGDSQAVQSAPGLMDSINTRCINLYGYLIPLIGCWGSIIPLVLYSRGSKSCLTHFRKKKEQRDLISLLFKITKNPIETQLITRKRLDWASNIRSKDLSVFSFFKMKETEGVREFLVSHGFKIKKEENWRHHYGFVDSLTSKLQFRNPDSDTGHSEILLYYNNSNLYRNDTLFNRRISEESFMSSVCRYTTKKENSFDQYVSCLDNGISLRIELRSFGSDPSFQWYPSLLERISNLVENSLTTSNVAAVSPPLVIVDSEAYFKNIRDSFVGGIEGDSIIYPWGELFTQTGNANHFGRLMKKFIVILKSINLLDRDTPISLPFLVEDIINIFFNGLKTIEETNRTNIVGHQFLAEIFEETLLSSGRTIGEIKRRLIRYIKSKTLPIIDPASFSLFFYKRRETSSLIRFTIYFVSLCEKNYGIQPEIVRKSCILFTEQLVGRVLLPQILIDLSFEFQKAATRSGETDYRRKFDRITLRLPSFGSTSLDMEIYTTTPILEDMATLSDMVSTCSQYPTGDIDREIDDRLENLSHISLTTHSRVKKTRDCPQYMSAMKWSKIFVDSSVSLENNGGIETSFKSPRGKAFSSSSSLVYSLQKFIDQMKIRFFVDESPSVSADLDLILILEKKLESGGYRILPVLKNDGLLKSNNRKDVIGNSIMWNQLTHDSLLPSSIGDGDSVKLYRIIEELCIGCKVGILTINNQFIICLGETIEEVSVEAGELFGFHSTSIHRSRVIDNRNIIYSSVYRFLLKLKDIPDFYSSKSSLGNCAVCLLLCCCGFVYTKKLKDGKLESNPCFTKSWKKCDIVKKLLFILDEERSIKRGPLVISEKKFKEFMES